MEQIRRQPPTELPAAFGRYRLLRPLGKGGMGTVFLAHDSQLDRTVALKVPQFDEGDGAHLLSRFYQEARAAAALQHPNICPIHDVGEVDGVPYITMAYIDGKLLGEVARLHPLQPRQSAALMRKLALALHEAHKRGVIHRDLKPANIMIDRRSEPVIMDFGLARRERQGGTRVTQEGRAMGTPAYMPPEQVNGDLAAMGPACDVYSLGVIFYELLAGQLPFTGDVFAVLARVLQDEPPPPSQFRPDLDEEIEAICLKAMAKKPADRHASMADLAAALQEYLRGKTVPAAKREAPAAPLAPAAARAGTKPGVLLETQTGEEQPTAVPAIEQRPVGKRKPARREGGAPPRRRRLVAWTWVAVLLGGLLTAGAAYTGINPFAQGGGEEGAVNDPPAAGPAGTGDGAKTEKAPLPPIEPAEARTLLDAAMQKYMDRIGCTAAALAIDRDGKAFHVKGYGWRDKERKTPVGTDTLFRMPRRTRVLVRASVYRLAEEKRVDLNDRLFGRLKIEPKGAVGPGIEALTVKNLLERQKDWDTAAIEKARKQARADGHRGPLGVEVVLPYLANQPPRENPDKEGEKVRFTSDILYYLIAKVTERDPIDYYRNHLLGRTLVGIVAADSPEAMEKAVGEWPGPAGLRITAPAVMEVMREFSEDGTRKYKEGRAGGLAKGGSHLLRWRPDGGRMAILFNGRSKSFGDLIGELNAILDRVKKGS